MTVRSCSTVAALVATLVLAANTSPASAQGVGHLEGLVLSKADGDPMVGVSVFVEGTVLGAATSDSGFFAIRGVPPGTWMVFAQFVGYETGRNEVVVRGNQVSRVQFELVEEPLRLGGIEVFALRPDLEPVSRIDDARVQELEPIDTGALLRELPGSNSARRGPIGLDPNIRGLSESQVGAYVDGVRFFPAGPLRMDSQISHFDPTGIARMEVVKGPYALMWGAGNMSAIRIETRGAEASARRPIQGMLQSGYTGNVNALQTAASLSGMAGRLSYWGHGVYRQGKDYQDGNGTVIPGEFDSGEARGRVGYRTGAATTVSVGGGFQRQNDVDYPGRLLNAAFFDERDVSGRFEHEGSGSLAELDVLAYWYSADHGMTNVGKPTYDAGEFPDGSPRPPLRIGVDAKLENVGGRVAAAFRADAVTRVTVGGDVYSARRDATRPLQAVMMDGSLVTPPFYDSDEVWPDVRVTDAGLFANVARHFGSTAAALTTRVDLVSATAGRASEAYLENVGVTSASALDANELHLSASGTVTAPFGSHWSASAGIGSVVRTADPLERFSDRFPASKAQMAAEFQGNPELKPERSTQGDLWVEADFPRVAVRLNGFARRIDNYITLEPTDIPPLLPLSPPTVFRYVNGEATFYGAEFSVTGEMAPNLFGSLGGSYLWGHDDRLDEPALGVSPMSVDIGVRWEASARVAFAEGVVHLVGDQDRVATARGETATAGYTTGDVRVGWRPHHQVSFLCGVNNIADRYFINHLNASNPFSGARIPEPGRSVLASIRVTI